MSKRILIVDTSDVGYEPKNLPTEDVTDAVGALYDLAVGSMDYGSGFWTADDAVPVAHLARAMGYKEVEELERYIASQAKQEAAARSRKEEEYAARVLANKRMKDPAWIFRKGHPLDGPS